MSTIESVNYWAKYNQFDIKVVENIEDFHKKDGTTVEKHTYSKKYLNTQVIHFKVVKGGHSMAWFTNSRLAYPETIFW